MVFFYFTLWYSTFSGSVNRLYAASREDENWALSRKLIRLKCARSRRWRGRHWVGNTTNTTGIMATKQREDEAEKPIKNSYAFALIFPQLFSQCAPGIPCSSRLVIISAKTERCGICLLINFYAFLQMFNPKKFSTWSWLFVRVQRSEPINGQQNFRFK